MIWLASVIRSKAARISLARNGSVVCCSVKYWRKRVEGKDWARDSRNNCVNDFLNTLNRSSLMEDGVAASSSSIESIGTESVPNNVVPKVEPWEAVAESCVAFFERLLVPLVGWLVVASKSYGSSGVVRVRFRFCESTVVTVVSAPSSSTSWPFKVKKKEGKKEDESQ